MMSELFHSKDFYLVILASLIFLSVFFVFRVIFLFLVDPQRRQERRLKYRLRQLEGLETSETTSTLLKKLSSRRSFSDQCLEKLRLFDHLQILMFQANLTWKRRTFLLVTALSGLAGLALGLVLGKGNVWWILPAVGLGLIIPYELLVLKRKRRLGKFEKQLPDALDLLARGLKAGHAFPAGLKQVAEDMSDPLGTEFFRTYSEFSHGLDLNNALQNLYSRVQLRDLSFFVTAVSIQRETGGNLTEILTKISMLIRERFKLRNQIKALTAEGRLSGIILCLLPPAIGLILFYLNPDYESQLVTTQKGWMLTVTAVVFQILGMLAIRKIVNIKV